MAPKAAQNKDTGPVKKSNRSRPTVSHSNTLKDRKALTETCESIGAALLAQDAKRAAKFMEFLQKQASGLLLKQYMDEWITRFDEHFKVIEKVVGKNLQLDESNMVNDLRAKTQKAGYDNMRTFLSELVMPAVSYHGLLLYLNNEARVPLPEGRKEELVDKMNALNTVLRGACFAMFMKENVGL